MRTSVTSLGVELAVEVVGEGSPVSVLAHGLTGSREDLAIFAPFLPGTKVLFDFRGHGESGRPPAGSYAMRAFEADLEAVADAFDATAFAGISLGGGAALRVMSRVPDRFDRMAILLPARLERSMTARLELLRLADLLERHPMDQVAEILLEEEGSAGRFRSFPSAREYRREVIMRMNRDGIPHAIRETIDDPPLTAEAVKNLRASCLVVGQRGDPVHAADVAEELAAAVPEAELLMFDDPDALLRDVPTVVQRVAAFLDA